MKIKREEYAQKMAEARHHARLENHGLKPVTVFVLPDDRGAIETAADQINRRRGYLNSVFDPTSRAPLILSTPEADAAALEASSRTARDIRMARLDRIYKRVNDKFRDALREHTAAAAEAESLPRRTPEHDAARARMRAACTAMERYNARSWKLAKAMIDTAGIDRSHAR